ncbi:hypothetical protein CJF30_00008094 [Rutstroemia sp. NJR-2017a BBW]|nr:hypothetical protein CJF30_00008094 [Rutstroemia sp. NJR-2017a BBW]
MPKQQGWIADRLKPNCHEFKIGNDTWLLLRARLLKQHMIPFREPSTNASVSATEKTQLTEVEEAEDTSSLTDDTSSPTDDASSPKDDASSPKSDSDVVGHPPWEEELQCLELLKQRYNDLKTKKEIPTKPFPDAIGLSKVEQEINFPVPGGKSTLN